MASTETGSGLLFRFRAVRERTDFLFSLITEEAFFQRPLPLRHPIVFYRGHLPAFCVNTLLKKALFRPGLRGDFEMLFERGIDPSDRMAASGAAISAWPPLAEVEAYVREASDWLATAFEEVDDGALRDEPAARRAAMMCLEHEEMHQETLLYIFHLLDRDHKRPPEHAPALDLGSSPAPEVIRVPAGRATLGAFRGEIPFGWDNEHPRMAVDVRVFEIDRFDVTNREFLEFVDADGYANRQWWSADDWAWREKERVEHPLYWKRDGERWRWRAMFDDPELPLSWPVYASQAEASAFAKWRGRRLPTEAEFHRAAYGTPEGAERAFPWGDDAPDFTRANFDMRRWDPVPVGSFPEGRSVWGIDDLLGNGWEWTSTPFSGFPGFSPDPLYAPYSTDFFDGRHFVMKGGSPATAEGLLRRSFRNWFQPHYPYPYATFRCVKDAS